MKPLTELAVLACDHATGIVAIQSSQPFVRIQGSRVLVGNDPANKGIGGCSNLAATIKPCTRTLSVEQGKSASVYVRGKPVCLDTVTGGTDGTPPSATKYGVKFPGQTLVHVDA